MKTLNKKTLFLALLMAGVCGGSALYAGDDDKPDVGWGQWFKNGFSSIGADYSKKDGGLISALTNKWFIGSAAATCGLALAGYFFYKYKFAKTEEPV